MQTERKINIRVKGANGEREVVKLFVEVMKGVEDELKGKSDFNLNLSEQVKRNSTQSDRGGYDIVGIPLLAVEVKFQESLNLNGAWQQCVKQAKKGEMPVLFYRKSRSEWKVRTYTALCGNEGCAMVWTIADMPAKDFLTYYAMLYRAYLLSG